MIPIRGTARHQRRIKKFRNRTRELQRAQRIAIAPAPNAWFDHWHYHADWRGDGNHSWKLRREFMRSLATVFAKTVAARDQCATPFQTWMMFSGRDAGEDATYLHTPNPNGTQFPVTFDDVEWDRPQDAWLLHELAPMLPALELRLGHATYQDAGDPDQGEPPFTYDVYFVAAVAIGVPLWRS